MPNFLLVWHRPFFFFFFFLRKVGVIPNEGWAWSCMAIFLLVWQRLRTLGTFSCDTAQLCGQLHMKRSLMVWVIVIPKEGWIEQGAWLFSKEQGAGSKDPTFLCMYRTHSLIQGVIKLIISGPYTKDWTKPTTNNGIKYRSCLFCLTSNNESTLTLTSLVRQPPGTLVKSRP